MAREQRTFTRVPFDHVVSLRDANGASGTCTIGNISRGGLSVSLGRYLRPGPIVEFEFADIGYHGQPVHFAASVSWCLPERDNPGRFRAGFQVLHREPESLGAISEVFYRAIAQAVESRAVVAHCG